MDIEEKKKIIFHLKEIHAFLERLELSQRRLEEQIKHIREVIEKIQRKFPRHWERPSPDERAIMYEEEMRSLKRKKP